MRGGLCPPAGVQEDSKRQLLQQLQHLDANYNGGLSAYIKNAKKLLQDAQAGMSELLYSMISLSGQSHCMARLAHEPCVRMLECAALQLLADAIRLLHALHLDYCVLQSCSPETLTSKAASHFKGMPPVPCFMELLCSCDRCIAVPALLA